MVYNIRIQSPFVLTPTRVKESLGIGFTVLSVDVEKEQQQIKIESVDDAVKAMVQQGYRALARANHPDLGGSTDVMMTINRAKKELLELLESLKV